MDVMAMINKAIALASEATHIYAQVKPLVEDATGPASADLASAQERLQAALLAANNAGVALDDAIAARLGE